MLINTYTGGGIVPALDVEAALPVAFQPLPAGAGLTVAFPQGCIVAESVANPGQFGKYDATNADLAVAKGVNMFPFVVDEFGKIFFGTGVTAGQWGISQQAASMYVRGYFRCEDLQQTVAAGQFTATAAGQLGRLISGTVASGILAMR